MKTNRVWLHFHVDKGGDVDVHTLRFSHICPPGLPSTHIPVLDGY